VTATAVKTISALLKILNDWELILN